MALLAPRLKPGATIGVMAPSNALLERHKETFKGFCAYMQDKGFKIVVSKHLYDNDVFETAAGTPEDRAADFNEMIKNQGIDAIWLFQGGDCANEMLPFIDFDAIRQNPKILVGKSDVDVITLTVNQQTGLITFHGPDSKRGDGRELDFAYTEEWLEKRFMRAEKDIPPTRERRCVREGVAEGRLVGCNINSMLKLVGTKYEPDFTNAVLLLETYMMKSSKLVMKLEQFDQMGVFEKVKGIVIGHNFEFDSPKGNFADIVAHKTRKYDFPILEINEFGHFQPHAFIPIGANVKVDATNKTFTIVDDFLA